MSHLGLLPFHPGKACWVPTFSASTLTRLRQPPQPPFGPDTRVSEVTSVDLPVAQTAKLLLSLGLALLSPLSTAGAGNSVSLVSEKTCYFGSGGIKERLNSSPQPAL